jgi:aspartyl aminopeptidase
VRLICEQTQIKPDEVVDLDLYLYDFTPSTTLGLRQEFVSSPRLDNLVSAYTSLTALTSLEEKDDQLIKVAVLYDH